MPENEAPQEVSEVGSSRTSIVDWNSSESESTTTTLSDYDFELNVTNSSISNSITTTVSGSVTSSSDSEVHTNYTLVPIPGLEGIRIPIDFNLRQLLIKVTETENLETVKYLRLRVIARDFSIQRLPIYLPNLRELNLNGSCLMTLRDLGCGMQSLEVLHVSRTGLNSLDGLFGLTGLVELYAANNNIKDVSPCSALQQVKVLDLANNGIKDAKTVHFLILCSTLKHLTLEGNPTTTIDNYRSTVKEILPDLESLDGVRFFNEEDRSLHRPLEILKLEEPSPVKLISRFPPILSKDLHKDVPELKPIKRPNTTGSVEIRNKEKDKLKILTTRPATARKAMDSDFSSIVNGSHLKLKDIRQLFAPSRLTSGRPMSGNPALGLWEKKKLESCEEFEE